MPKGLRRQRPNGAPFDAYSIQEFCDAHGFSIAMYYVLRKQNQTPREMRVGRHCMIFKEAAADWRRERERGRHDSLS